MAGTKYDAKEFVQRWRSILEQVPDGKNNEQQDTAKFWQDLLVNVLGVPSSSMATFVDFERKVRGRRIDVFVSDHHFLCEQKSVGVDLDKPEPRNGGLETPYQQDTDSVARNHLAALSGGAANRSLRLAPAG